MAHNHVCWLLLLTESITCFFIYELIVMLLGFLLIVLLFEFEFCLSKSLLLILTLEEPSRNGYRLLTFAQALIFVFIIFNRNPAERLKTYKTLLLVFTIHLRAPDWVERMCHVPLPLLYKGAVCFSQVEVRNYCISSVKTWAHKWINESDEWNKRRLQTQKHHLSGGASKSSCSDWPVCFITLIIFPQDLKTWGFSTRRERRGKQRFGLF